MATINSISSNDLISILDSILNERKSLISHHISSFDNFIEEGIKQIMQHTFRIIVEMNNMRDATPEDLSIEKYSMEAKILNVDITNPVTINYDTQKPQILYPCEAHRQDLTYSSPIFVDAEIICTAYKKDGTTLEKRGKIDHFRIGSIPVMVGSKLCNTINLSRDALINLNEDPTDLGGYFVIKSNEWIVDNIESMTYNLSREFKNAGFKNELARSDIISKPGDNFENSSNLLCKYLANGNIVFEITNNKFKNIAIPFYVLFRAFGICSDKQIIEHITYGLDTDDPIIEKMLNILNKAYNSQYSTINNAYTVFSQVEILELIGKHINEVYLSTVSTLGKTNLNTRKYNINNVLMILDKDVLPHVGLTPDDRYNKVRFLGHIIHRLLLAHLDIIPPTDRDSYKNKRVNPAGVSYAKVFKQNFNFSIVQPLRNQFVSDLKSTSFSNLNLSHCFETAIYGHEFEKALIHAIITGDKEMVLNRKVVQNRLSSQQLHRKNPINVISALRNINTTNTSSAKQSVRANEMRRVHSSTIGYVCCIQSADTGEKVGMQKQMAISARISLGSSSEILKDILLKDNDLIKLTPELTNADIYNKKLTKVFVNGYWLGCCSNYAEFASKYRIMRRTWKIHYMTSINMDVRTNDLYFWVDIGRMLRPLIIIYNNEKEYYKSNKTIKFEQYIKLTKQHILDLNAGIIMFDDLIDQGIIEYISPEEQQNCLISKDIETLNSHINDPLTRFTHLDISQAIIGIPGLTSPYSNHNQPARGIFQTNQVKQTCGIPCMNFPYKSYKEMYVQIYNQKPLVKTLANKYIPPIGLNSIVAITYYGGYNQDDSLIINKGAIDKGLFTTHHFTFEKTELEKNEKIENPDTAITADIKAYSNYSKLVNGVVTVGTYIQNGDIIIGKTCKLNKSDQYDNYKYYDKSIVYKYDEPSYVWDVIKGRNEDDTEFCKITFRSVRKVEIGNKFCITDDHEILTENGWKYINKVNTDEPIATLDISTNEMKYEVPQTWNMFEVDNEDLYSMNSTNAEIVCTMNHKLVIKKNNKNILSEVKDLINEEYQIQRKSILENRNDIDNFYLKGFVHENERYKRFNTKDKKINMDDFLMLLGIYIAEGHIDNKNQTRISAHKERVMNQMILTLNNLTLKYCIYKNEENYIYIKDRGLSHYLKQFGKGIHKYLPEFVWKLNQRQCIILFNGLMLGDGNTDGTEYYTQSKQLADDFQRLVVHCGYVSTSKIKNQKGEILKIKNKETICNSDLYRIRISKQNKFEAIIKPSNSKLIKYSGKVYCPTNSNHTFMIRKNGKVYWSANSSRSG